MPVTAADIAVVISWATPSSVVGGGAVVGAPQIDRVSVSTDRAPLVLDLDLQAAGGTDRERHRGDASRPGSQRPGASRPADLASTVRDAKMQDTVPRPAPTPG